MTTMKGSVVFLRLLHLCNESPILDADDSVEVELAASWTWKGAISGGWQRLALSFEEHGREPLEESRLTLWHVSV